MRNYASTVVTMLSATFAFAGSSQQDTSARLQAAGLVMSEIMAAPDKGIPAEVLHGAKCIAVIPDMAKGAFLVGGEHGRGVVTCRTGHGWSAPAFISIGGGNFGFQAGGQSVDLVMLFMNDKGVQGLLSSKFELTGEASATAGPVGRHASAGRVRGTVVSQGPAGAHGGGTRAPGPDFTGHQHAGNDRLRSVRAA